MRTAGDRPWFGPKSYGWGFAPITWEGWASVAAYAAALFSARRLMGGPADVGGYLAVAAVLTAALLGLAWWKRDRSRGVGWRWGGD
jgi:hypothetical protein